MKPHHGDPNQALVWGGCGRQRSLARYKANPTSFLYQANFPGLGRGLRGASGTPAKYAGTRQTSPASAEACAGRQGRQGRQSSLPSTRQIPRF